MSKVLIGTWVPDRTNMVSVSSVTIFIHNTLSSTEDYLGKTPTQPQHSSAPLWQVSVSFCVVDVLSLELRQGHCHSYPVKPTNTSIQYIDLTSQQI